MNLPQVLPMLLLALSLALAVHPLSAQGNITLYPPGDTVAIIGSCVPPEFQWRIVEVTSSLHRAVIDSYDWGMGIGIPPNHMIEWLDSVYFEIRDTLSPNTYQLRYTSHSTYYPGECIVAADTVYWAVPDSFDLTLLVFEDRSLVDSATMHFMGYQFGLDVKEEPPLLPTIPGLEQNYPNPFNPTTTISYALPRRSHVMLTVYNTLGQQVATLVDADIDAGNHTVQFDASNLTSGVYFYRLQTPGFVQTRKLLLIQ